MMNILLYCVHLRSTVITFVVKAYYICGQLLHLWSRLITFVVVITFVVNYYICGFYTLHSDVTSTMFVDDTTILVRGLSITSISTLLNEVARSVSTWADKVK